jgi:transcriptional regulator with XRE-family HTH domain
MAVDPAVPDPERIATQADFGRELKALRERAGLTIRDLAKASGLPPSTVGDYSSGKHLPTDPVLLERTLRACGETHPERVAQWKAALVRAKRAPGRRTDTPQCPDEEQRREFITAVCDLARSTLVILTVRADFYDHAIRYPGLAAALQERQVALGPMTPGQVRRAITEPARVAKVDVEDGLVALLLADLPPDEAGALPLLSHAMLATWQNSRGGTLNVAHYLASGGIEDALTRTAEAAFASLTAGQRRGGP